ncbi:MAG: polysaccharide pyruvyl transferase family protein, partial [Leptolyngbya sp.]|nr:polysaccharide pyruvyl transferase family protein [Leptolyngbya sp.]
MSIYAYERRDRAVNFGDALNGWLWPRLWPTVEADTAGGTLVAIGTVVNSALPQRLPPGPVWILGAGAGYERPLGSRPNHWRIYALRGPLSAQRLGVSPELAVTDAAVLLRRCLPGVTAMGEGVAVMPHIHHAVEAGEFWRRACDLAGMTYLDPRDSVAAVTTAIRGSGLLLAEAMHGAIAADALGTPWVPLITSPRMLRFKWRDWCASVQVPYRPWSLPPLTTYRPYGRGVRSGFLAAQHWGQIPKPLWGANRDEAALAAALHYIAERAEPMLSDRNHLETLTQRLEQCLET